MREILFSGKRIDTGAWVEGYLVKFALNHITEWWEIHTGQTFPNGERERYRVDPETVGQYTGLTDKNGRKVFEGDVVLHAGEVWTITYITKYARFAGTAPKRIMGIFAIDACEVIGNIHDNPELLKGGDG